jgi:hypothetical protein
MHAFLKALTKAQIVKSALKVSMVVGTILNLINQNGLMLDNGSISWMHVLMNYAVPYCVSSYSAAMNEISA